MRTDTDRIHTEHAGPQEGVCNWCGQLRGRRVGKGVIIITCADPVYGKKFPVITMIPTKTLTAKIIHKHNFIGCDTWSLPPGDHLHHGGLLFSLIYEGGATSIANSCCQITTEQFDKVQFTQKHVIMLIKTVGYRHCPLVKGFKVGLNVSVSGPRCFIAFSRGVSIFISFR